MQYKILITLLSIGLLTGCSTSKVVTIDEVEERFLDTMTITPSDEEMAETNYKRPVYQATATRKHDLLHTSLDVRFDWEKQHLLGKATLTLKPYFYPTNLLTLDAKGFDFHKVSILKNGVKSDTEYDYDGLQITIGLDKEYKATEEYKVYIEYTAKPNELDVEGSAAITSAKGLYFINPTGEDKTKPIQLWTQGETEASSCWFPTIDKPNERCTQEIKITVADKFQTLSNGVMKSSNKNADGTRTDYYVMDKPHAPYLFMMAVGEYAVVKESWEGIPLEYYVEPEYRPFAKEIFNHTPEMLTFFSDILGVKYPWSKYAQVIVRDFVSGAMENTTGVIFGEFVQKTDRELIDNDNDRIVAHELIHHWFGDLVTCESWSNLPLNESFANYGEYMWMEYKDGKDAAENHRMNEINGYMSQDNRGSRHDLIDFEYNNKEDMFDGHSYNKGGAILHMLRNYVGDDAFYASLNHYLQENLYSDVEAHELRIAFEDITGEDLNWFFNQWFFDQGHPEMEYSYTYSGNNLKVTVEQKQDAKSSVPVYRILMPIDIYTSKGKTRENVWVDERKQTFTFNVSEKPSLVNVDPEYTLLCQYKDVSKTTEEYVYQYYNGKEFLDRYKAIEKLQSSDLPAAKRVIVDALNDPFWVIRRKALNALGEGQEDKVMAMGKSDKHSKVRTSALKKIGQTGNKAYVGKLKSIIDTDRAYNVVGAALSSLNEIDDTEALTYASKLEKEDNSTILSAVGDIYAASGDAKHLSFFENAIPGMSGFGIFSFFEQYSSLLKNADAPTINKSMGMMKEMASNKDVWTWKRFCAAKTINDIRGSLVERLGEETDEAKRNSLQEQITSFAGMLTDIQKTETNKRLLGMYKNFK